MNGPPVDGDAPRMTYRYLRLSVVGLALLLAVSLTLEILTGRTEGLGSISAYYYSPVRPVLVGTLVALAPALIAIAGRRGPENTLLDLAGMLAPVVALVPAPLDAEEAAGCPGGAERCIPAASVASVENNVTALLVVGAVGIVVAWWSVGPRGRADPTTAVGAGAAAVTWAVATAWFWFGRESFLQSAHYAAAVLFFLLVSAVAWVNARQVRRRTGVRLLTPSGYSRWYRAISSAVLVTLVAALLLAVVTAATAVELWYATTFVVEAVLLLLFVAFWSLQTAENWDDDAAVPPAAR